VLKHQFEQERDNNEFVDILPKMKIIKASLDLIGSQEKVKKN
jgi:5-methylcytosine-specific restriction endonuclease McrBC regulatory subunit McrC